jgi:hypothetical protein
MSEKVEKMLELTPKQQKFVDIFIEKGHLQTAKQCALDAGYSESTATVTAPETLFRRPLNYSQAPLSVIPRPLAKNIPCVPLAPDPSPRAGSSSC